MLFFSWTKKADTPDMKQNIIATEVMGLRAITSSGVFVKVEIDTFLNILSKINTPLVVISREKAFFSVIHKCLTSYKGFSVLR
jgi:hypothetical protein